MAKLDGTVQFAGLFTVVNEQEQVRYQAFVPTKALEHVKAGLRGICSSLAQHGLSQPVLAFTDNVQADYSTAIECIPSLRDGVTSTAPRSAGMKLAELPSPITVFPSITHAAIENACTSILAAVEDYDGAAGSKPLGIKMAWQYRTGDDEGNSARQIAWVVVATLEEVHIFYVSQLILAKWHAVELMSLYH